MAQSVIWIVIGSFFGGFFVITYCISAVKAVKDRKRLKIIRDAKRRARLEIHSYTNKANNSVPCGNGIEIPDVTIQIADDETTERYSKSTSSNLKKSATDDQKERDVIKSNGKAFQKYSENSVPKTNSESYPCSSIARYDGITHNASILNPSTLSHECLSVTKLLRRQSYEVAVAQFSLLQQEPPKYATSRDIQTVYEGKVYRSTSYDNRAYDSEMSKNT